MDGPDDESIDSLNLLLTPSVDPPSNRIQLDMFSLYPVLGSLEPGQLCEQLAVALKTTNRPVHLKTGERVTLAISSALSIGASTIEGWSEARAKDATTTRLEAMVERAQHARAGRHFENPCLDDVHLAGTICVGRASELGHRDRVKVEEIQDEVEPGTERQSEEE